MKCLIFLLSIFLCSLALAQDGAARLDTFFERVDQDGDGKISKAELEAAGQRTTWAEKADQNQDGLIDKAEVAGFFRRVSSRANESAGEVAIVQQTKVPEGAPITQAGIASAEKYSAQHDGHSFLLMLDGQVIRESYANGWDQNTGHRLASGTKSFSGALLALAVKDGLLTLDEPVSNTLTEWKDDERLKVITIRELLNLTSGIEPGDNGRVLPYARVVDVKAVSGAGEAFRYGPNAFQLFGEVIKRKLALHEDLPFDDPLAYLEAKVFDPIGMTFTEWRRDVNGMPHLPSGAFITAPEWGKFGQWLLEEGELGGAALVDKNVLKEATRPVSAVNPAYGLTFWLLGGRTDAERPWLEGAYLAAGAGKQCLYVLPAAEMVLVRQGESRTFENLDFLDALFSLDSASDFGENGE
ncbi:MAG: serine hydrolase [Verrucomicrobiota bacterium]